MEKKKLIWVLMAIGTLMGSTIGDSMAGSMFSMSGVFWSTVLGGLGIYFGMKYGEY